MERQLSGAARCTAKADPDTDSIGGCIGYPFSGHSDWYKGMEFRPSLSDSYAVSDCKRMAIIL